MNIKQLKEIVARCASLDPNDDFTMMKCWEEMTDILSDDISATVDFFENQCTDEELFWLSSIFDDVAEKIQSKELIQVLRNRLAKVVPETYCQQNFKSELLRKHIDYNEYIKYINKEIGYAEETIW